MVAASSRGSLSPNAERNFLDGGVLDQFHAQFDPKDPELGGRYAIERGVPPLDKMSTAADAKRFLTASLERIQRNLVRKARCSIRLITSERPIASCG